MISANRISKFTRLLFVLAFLLGAASIANSREPATTTPFKFVGGTENIPDACVGLVEVESTRLTFKCPGGSVPVPYAAIKFMQYRPDVSKKVRKMKLPWKVKPHLNSPLLGGNKNRYFTVVYEEKGNTKAIVLEVSPGKMRPYLAEIDVKAGKRVEVKEYEEYN